MAQSSSDNLAAEPAYCPACDLKHVRQPDWLCPQCGMPVETAAWRSAVGSRAEEVEERERGYPLGSFVAGVVLSVTSVILALGFARNPGIEHRWTLVGALVLLLVLGLELLLKVSPARWVVLTLALVALAVVADDRVRTYLPGLMSDPLPPAIRAAMQGPIRALHPLRIHLLPGLLVGALLLVVGRPGRWRIAAGVVVAGPLAVAEIVRWLVP